MSHVATESKVNIKDNRMSQFSTRSQTSVLILTKFEQINYPPDIYMFKVNNKNTRTSCEICSKLTIKTPERRQWRRSGVFINFEYISQLVPVFLLLTLNM